MSLRFASVPAVLAAVPLAAAQSNYLALGDSVAFGLHKDPNGTFGYNAPSNGDRGYVAAIADAVGSLEGVRPNVINLSIPGETSTGLSDTTNLFRGANTNYGSNPFLPRQISQLDFAAEKIAALGQSITTVSFAIGANDFLALDGTLQKDPATAGPALAAIAGVYTNVLTSIRTALPNARLILPGYYNPYQLNDPKHAVAAQIVPQLNALIQTAASAPRVNGRYVDFYTPIEGNQASLLYTGDIHPNDTGYAVLGRSAAQAVPEPPAMAALGLGSLALLRRRTRRA